VAPHLNSPYLLTPPLSRDWALKHLRIYRPVGTDVDATQHALERLRIVIIDLQGALIRKVAALSAATVGPKAGWKRLARAHTPADEKIYTDLRKQITINISAISVGLCSSYPAANG
jgi:hypothetical protein